MMKRFEAVFVSVVVTVGCGGGVRAGADSGPAGDAGSVPAADRCEAYYASYGARCGWTPDEIASCQDRCPCQIAITRPEVQEPMYACLETQTCGSGSDDCLSAASAMGGEGRPAVAEYVAACMAERASCRFDDVHCVLAGMMTDAVFAAMSGCLGQPCDAIEACFAAAYGAACAR